MNSVWLKTKFVLKGVISILIGGAFERLCCPSRGGNLNDPTFKSSNAQGVAQGVGRMLKFRIDRRIMYDLKKYVLTDWLLTRTWKQGQSSVGNSQKWSRSFMMAIRELLSTEFSDSLNGFPQCWSLLELVAYESGRKKSFCSLACLIGVIGSWNCILPGSSLVSPDEMIIKCHNQYRNSLVTKH